MSVGIGVSVGPPPEVGVLVGGLGVSVLVGVLVLVGLGKPPKLIVMLPVIVHPLLRTETFAVL